MSELIKDHPKSTLTIKCVNDNGAVIYIHLSQPKVIGIGWTYKDGKAVDEIVTLTYQKITVTY